MVRQVFVFGALILTLSACPRYRKIASHDGGVATLTPTTPATITAAAPDPPPSASAATTAAPHSLPFVTGETWNGSYVCSQGSTTLALHIKKGGTAIEAVFDFKTSGGVMGQFKMSGTYATDTRHLHLNAGDWIVQPPRYITVDLDGSVGADNHSFSGTVLAAGCTTFSVRR